RFRVSLKGMFGVPLHSVVVSALTVALLLGLWLLIRSRRRVISALSESEARYRDVVESQSDLICRYLPDTTLTFVNEAYCRFFNQTASELVGSRFLTKVPEAGREDVFRRITECVETRQRFEQLHEVTAPNGELAWMRWSNVPIPDEHGRVTELQGVGRDVTEQHQVTEALRQSHVRNEALLRAL